MNSSTSPLWFVFYKDQILLEKRGDSLRIPSGDIPPVEPEKETNIHEISLPDDICFKAFSIPTPIEESVRYTMIGLRASYDFIPLKYYKMGGKAAEILHWDQNSRFCSACGTLMEQKDPIMKKCPSCSREVYPAISTAVLVLIRKEDSILLVHAHNFSGPFHSLVAGFLETGESLEECVHREVKEETRLEISNITYFGSQPWPYPSGLMVGFIADYVSGDIQLQDEELSEGAFYTRNNLPQLPRKLSLARKMIDWWMENLS